MATGDAPVLEARIELRGEGGDLLDEPPGGRAQLPDPPRAHQGPGVVLALCGGGRIVAWSRIARWRWRWRWRRRLVARHDGASPLDGFASPGRPGRADRHRALRRTAQLTPVRRVVGRRGTSRRGRPERAGPPPRQAPRRPPPGRRPVPRPGRSLRRRRARPPARLSPRAAHANLPASPVVRSAGRAPRRTRPGVSPPRTHRRHKSWRAIPRTLSGLAVDDPRCAPAHLCRRETPARRARFNTSCDGLSRHSRTRGPGGDHQRLALQWGLSARDVRQRVVDLPLEQCPDGYRRARRASHKLKNH